MLSSSSNMTLTNYTLQPEQKSSLIIVIEREFKGFPNICRLYKDYYSFFVLRRPTIMCPQSACNVSKQVV